MKNKYLLISMLLILLVLPMVSAEQQSLGTFKQNTDINLQQMANASYCNITSILYPNSTTILTNLIMTKNGLNFNYTLDKAYTNIVGSYIINGECNTEVWAYNVDITENGKPAPEGVVIIIFSIAFFLIFGWNLLSLVVNLEHLAKLDLDMYNLISSLGCWFSLFFYYYLATLFFANSFILNTSMNFLYFFGVMNLFIPILAFVLSMTIGKMRRME